LHLRVIFFATGNYANGAPAPVSEFPSGVPGGLSLEGLKALGGPQAANIPVPPVRTADLGGGVPIPVSRPEDQVPLPVARPEDQVPVPVARPPLLAQGNMGAVPLPPERPIQVAQPVEGRSLGIPGIASPADSEAFFRIFVPLCLSLGTPRARNGRQYCRTGAVLISL
jgi:hypothetical protein